MTSHPLRVFVSCLVLAIMIAAAGDAEGCSCMRSTAACEAVWESAAVFVGDVVQIEDTSQAVGGGRAISSRRVRLRVTEAFRGDVGGTVEVLTGRGGGDCGFNFVMGQRYIVYAGETPTGYHTGICQRTRPAVEAAEDLKYLRSLAQSTAAAGAIVGTVTHLEPDVQGDLTWRTPFAGARIVIDADGRRFEGLSGGDGRYEVVVPPGTYRVTVDVPESYHVRRNPIPPNAVRVQDARGCASVDVTVQANGRIAGRVVDAEGVPVPNLTIEAQSVRPAARRFPYTPESARAITNAAGEYELSALHPGSYTVGIYAGWRVSDRNPDERPAFAGGRDTKVAAPVAVPAGVRIQIDDFTLPPALAIAQVIGTVRLPDGTPAAGGLVYLYAEGVPNRSLAEPATIGADGRFSIGVVAGKRYRFVAELLLSNPRRLFTAQSEGFEAIPGLKTFDVALVRR
jgi:hypothetical protein